MSKPTLVRGTRDFAPEQVAKRQLIIQTARKVFEQYGFQPLETPAMENLAVLTGKYGEEGDQLLFKILNSGDFTTSLSPEDRHLDGKAMASKIAEKGLRYDLTVPFARYVAMNRGTLIFPFKRYQMQPVWRADRPQKGRYREFYQCDADVIGTSSLVCEAEIIHILHDVFRGLGITEFTVKINHRKILSGLAEVVGAGAQEGILFTAIDKLDKIGRAGVFSELVSKGFNDASLSKINDFLNLDTKKENFRQVLGTLLERSEAGRQGLKELEEIRKLSEAYAHADLRLETDISLARGLSYYTGIIFEVKALNVEIGSISGGGRYDNLTGAFGAPDLTGVGISLGIDRIYDVMEQCNLFKNIPNTVPELLISHFDEPTLLLGLSVLDKVRKAGLRAEVYPDAVKLKKQLDYANRKGIPYMLLIGSDEISEGLLTLKNMENGEQTKLPLDDIIIKLKKQYAGAH